MYIVSWIPRSFMPDEITVAKVQYLPDLDAVIRKAFGEHGTDKVVIVKEAS